MHVLVNYFTKYPEHAKKVVLCIKGGISMPQLRPDGSRESVHRSVDNIIKALDGKKSLDLFECARVDPEVPIETTIAALAEYVKEGKIKGISLSEVRAETIRRAHKVHPISAVVVELSLWDTDVLENGIAATCAELGIPLVAYSPLGRGFLTGQIKSLEDIPDGDHRKRMPRFQPDAFEKNLEMLDELERLAKQKRCTPAQLALAWVKQLNGKPGMRQIIPIPGASAEKRVIENMQEIKLSDADLNDIDQFLKSRIVIGERYSAEHAVYLNG